VLVLYIYYKTIMYLINLVIDFPVKVFSREQKCQNEIFMTSTILKVIRCIIEFQVDLLLGNTESLVVSNISCFVFWLTQYHINVVHYSVCLRLCVLLLTVWTRGSGTPNAANEWLSKIYRFIHSIAAFKFLQIYYQVYVYIYSKKK
jgi:ABC-type multidrug transport system permease subunit